jgi:hypothetical protein
MRIRDSCDACSQVLGPGPLHPLHFEHLGYQRTPNCRPLHSLCRFTSYGSRRARRPFCRSLPRVRDRISRNPADFRHLSNAQFRVPKVSLWTAERSTVGRFLCCNFRDKSACFIPAGSIAFLTQAGRSISVAENMSPALLGGSVSEKSPWFGSRRTLRYSNINDM